MPSLPWGLVPYLTNTTGRQKVTEVLRRTPAASKRTRVLPWWPAEAISVAKRSPNRKPSPGWRRLRHPYYVLTAVNWRRNLAALWLAEFTAILGFSFAFPFLPLFLHRELHIPNGPELSFWTGVSASATGFALALTSPIWGRLADRYGRKPMLVRAMIGGGISVGLMGLAQSALQLTVLRGVQGASSGTVAAATALVATETPAPHPALALRS